MQLKAIIFKQCGYAALESYNWNQVLFSSFYKIRPQYKKTKCNKRWVCPFVLNNWRLTTESKCYCNILVWFFPLFYYRTKASRLWPGYSEEKSSSGSRAGPVVSSACQGQMWEEGGRKKIVLLILFVWWFVVIWVIFFGFHNWIQRVKNFLMLSQSSNC